jgi:hypothetical protein
MFAEPIPVLVWQPSSVLGYENEASILKFWTVLKGKA